jgi:hypothetical protein
VVIANSCDWPGPLLRCGFLPLTSDASLETMIAFGRAGGPGPRKRPGSLRDWGGLHGERALSFPAPKRASTPITAAVDYQIGRRKLYTWITRPTPEAHVANVAVASPDLCASEQCIVIDPLRHLWQPFIDHLISV